MKTAADYLDAIREKYALSSDRKAAASVYVGEGKNSGFGTLMNPAGAIEGCFSRALDNLPAR